MENTDDKNEIQELTSTLFTLRGLSHDLSQERDVIMASASQINFSSKQFQKYTERFDEQIEESKNQIKNIITQEIKHVAKAITDEVSQALVQGLPSKIETMLDKLQQLSNQCERDLTSSAKKISFFSKWFISVALGGALIGGILAGTMIHYLPSHLDQRTKEKIHAGELLEAVWPKLEKKERDKILEFNKSRGTGK